MAPTDEATDALGIEAAGAARRPGALSRRATFRERLHPGAAGQFVDELRGKRPAA